MKHILLLFLMACPLLILAQESPQWQGKFEQLDQTLPTPNEYRTGMSHRTYSMC